MILDRGWTMSVPDAPGRPVDIAQDWERQGLADYSGVATYECAFNVDGDVWPGSWVLDFPRVGTSLEAELNGSPIGRCGHAPYQLILSADRLRAGDNLLRVHVWNTAANAFYSSEERERRRLASGLIGAPTLRPVLMLQVDAKATTIRRGDE